MNSDLHPLSKAYLNLCYQTDAAKIRRRLYRVNKEAESEKKFQTLAQLTEAAQQAYQKAQQRLQSRPIISYPDELPVSQKRDDIASAIANNQVV
ncbi:MAG TPA: hypothetical protein DDW91_14600, partial [Shewanella frigidimarina]|nr:hypothetical protein [Shewanella frigidimarina]